MSARRTESGMATRAVNAAAGVLLAAMQQGRQTPTGLAIALDSARLLNSPETAAELDRLRSRVAELEELVVAKDRPVDEDPIAYALTDVAHDLAAERSADRLTRLFAPTQTLRLDDEVSPRQQKLRSLLAGQREQVQGGGA